MFLERIAHDHTSELGILSHKAGVRRAGAVDGQQFEQFVKRGNDDITGGKAISEIFEFRCPDDFAVLVSANIKRHALVPAFRRRNEA